MGAPAEKVVLRRYLEEALAQVRALQAKQRRESTFGSVRQLAAHIRELADAELRTVPGYREAEARRDAPSRDVVCERIRQETPANLVDGMWANTFAPTSVPTRWQLMVEKIRWEEQGEGELEKNHAYMWTQLLSQVGPPALPPPEGGGCTSVTSVRPPLPLCRARSGCGCRRPRTRRSPRTRS